VSELLPGAVTFISFYVLMVLVMGLWSRLLTQRVAADNFRRSLRRYNFTLLAMRAAVPAWFGFGVFTLGWGWVVHGLLGKVLGGALVESYQLPGLLLGLLPPLAAWMGLWWAQYPAERALREQNVLPQLEADLPVYGPPTFREYFFSNLRLQVLFTIVPVLLIVLTRDLLSLGFQRGGSRPEWFELAAMFASAAVVFVFAPEVLRRVLHTEPLPDGPLRRKLEALCRRTRMRYRDILVWRTHNNLGNAAVMGILPQMRYILLSDLLLETMSDEQVEAVFAHEVGHVIHRHMAWYVVFFLIVFLGGLAADRWAAAAASGAPDPAPSVAVVTPPPAPDEPAGVPTAAGEDLPAWLTAVTTMAGFLVVFGFLSRRFERQADVFAARVMSKPERPPAQAPPAAVGADEVPGNGFNGLPAATANAVGEPAADGNLVVPPPAAAPPAPLATVAPYGANLFASALQRVAVVNNIPITPRGRWRGGPARRAAYMAERVNDVAQNWLHGSILQRMQYLQRLSADPALTRRFDRFMVRLYCLLLLLLFVSAACVLAADLFPAGRAVVQ
jgi:STE24 endopeptidase